jgi:hypothetical protein
MKTQVKAANYGFLVQVSLFFNNKSLLSTSPVINAKRKGYVCIFQVQRGFRQLRILHLMMTANMIRVY